MERWIFSLILILAFSAHSLAAGAIRVIDGDTLALGDVHMRLAYIDAPEIRQNCTDGVGVDYACGLSAKTALSDIINDRPVTCHTIGFDRYHRHIAVCHTRTVRDIGAEMVRRGWAVDYRDYDKGCTYCEIEAEAQKTGKGMWDGRFEMPWQWRVDHGK